MRARVLRSAVFAALPLVCVVLDLPLRAADDLPTTYVLASGSTFQRGCFDPCDCVTYDEEPLHGTFNLRHVSSDPDWFETYEVSDVHWKTLLYGEEVSITGTGTYRIGGNFALRHELVLDLVVGSDPVEHYQSGTIVGGSEFPAIVIKISIHGEYCYDTVIKLVAKPATTVSVSAGGLTWDPLPIAAGYDIIRGDLGSLLASGGDFALATTECIAADRGVPEVSFNDVPEPGTAFWFLVRAEGETITATYDSGYPQQVRSRDPGIAAAPTCCP